MVSILKANASLVAAALLSALLVVGVLTFAGPCVHDDGTQGACFAASQAIFAAAIVALATSVAAVFLKSMRVRGVLSLVAAGAGVLAAASPGTLFPLCMVQTMRCWTVMRPFALVVGIIIAICGVVAAARAFSGKANRQAARRKAGRA